MAHRGRGIRAPTPLCALTQRGTRGVPLDCRADGPVTIRATTPGCQAGLVRGHGIGPSCMAAAGVGPSVHIRSGGRDKEAECARGRRAAETTGGAGSTEIKLGCVPPRRAKSRPGASRACRFVRTMLDRGVAAEDDRAIFSGGALGRAHHPQIALPGASNSKRPPPSRRETNQHSGTHAAAAVARLPHRAAGGTRVVFVANRSPSPAAARTTIAARPASVPAPESFLGHLIAREFSQEECRDEEAG